jgi:hemerythrin-like domain-containing protein
MIAAVSSVPAALTTDAFAQKSGAALTPNEDLMHEHGLVTRVILIYKRAGELLDANEKLDVAGVGEAAKLIAGAIHGNHEVEEEQIIFPLVEKSADLQSLTAILRGQHNAARALTAAIGKNATTAAISNAQGRKELTTAMRDFANMYEAHGAYEDTVIYPAFRHAVSDEQYRKYGQQFQANDRRINGEDGFARATATLAKIEASLGLELARYTKQMAGTAGDAPVTAPKK